MPSNFHLMKVSAKPHPILVANVVAIHNRVPGVHAYCCINQDPVERNDILRISQDYVTFALRKGNGNGLHPMFVREMEWPQEDAWLYTSWGHLVEENMPYAYRYWLMRVSEDPISIIDGRFQEIERILTNSGAHHA